MQWWRNMACIQVWSVSTSVPIHSTARWKWGFGSMSSRGRKSVRWYSVLAACRPGTFMYLKISIESPKVSVHLSRYSCTRTSSEFIHLFVQLHVPHMYVKSCMYRWSCRLCYVYMHTVTYVLHYGTVLQKVPWYMWFMCGTCVHTFMYVVHPDTLSID